MAYYDSHQYHHQPRHSRPSAGYAHDYYYGGGSSGAHHPHPLDVVPRRDPSDESVEEIPRDYPPGEYYEYGTGYPPQPRRTRVATVQEGVRRSHSMGGGRSGAYYDDSDYAYRPSRGRRSRHHDDRHSKYSRSPSSSSSRSPPRHHRRRKSFSEQALGALGLGTAAAAGSGRARERSRGRHSRSYSYSPSPTRSSRRHHRSDKDSGRVRDRSEQRIASAVKAAVTAGAVEAFRLRKDKGEWTGDKGKRILTAALSAGGTGGLVGSDPEKKSKRHLIESTLAGLATNHFVNGPRSRSRSRSRHGRNKSKSRVENLAATGALAAAGKQAWEAYQKRSRSHSRGRGRSPDDYDRHGSSRRPRSRSVSDYISRGLEALGLDSGPSKDKDKKSRDYPDEDDYRRRRRRHRSGRYSDEDESTAYYSDDDRYGSDYGRRGSRRTRHSRDVGQHHYLPPSSRPRTETYPLHPPHTNTATTTDTSRGRANPDENSTDECEEELEDEETIRKRQNKLTRETVLATGLATVATIHAAHGLHESMNKHRENAAAVRAGDMTEEEARRRKLRGGLSDAANVGLAALGIKGVVGQWQHADAKRKERKSLIRECSMKRERARSRAQRHGFREGLRRRASSYGDVPRKKTVYPDEVEEVNSFDHHHSGEYDGYGSGYGYAGASGYDRGRRESSWY